MLIFFNDTFLRLRVREHGYRSLIFLNSTIVKQWYPILD